MDLLNIPPWLWSKCLSVLREVCGHRALLPTSLKIPLHYDRSAPLDSGGHLNIWKGKYQGRYVAVKVLRTYVIDKRVVSVSSQDLSPSTHKAADSFLSRGSVQRS